MDKPYLFINTVNSNLPSFAIFDEKGNVETFKFINKQENLNKNLSLFFKRNRLDIKDIKAVLALTGPGSFSASRAGVVFANSFNFLQSAPILGIKDEEGKTMVDILKKYTKKLKNLNKDAKAEVYYKHKPNITFPKKTE